MSREPQIAADEALVGSRAIGPTPRLTRREHEVLALVTLGRSNREIAAELSIGTSTVKSHLSSVYEKLGVSNRTQAGVAGWRIRMLPGSTRQDTPA